MTPPEHNRIIWRPELLPIALVLAATPTCFETARLDAVAALLPGLSADHADGRHFVVDEPAGPHQLWSPEPTHDPHLGVLIPLDADFRVRVDAAMRFQRRLVGMSAGPLPRGWRLTAMQRRRLVAMLRALDGRLAGASYRNIALALLDAEAAHWPAREWKSSAARSHVIRLVADAFALMNGGYRKLLRGR